MLVVDSALLLPVKVIPMIMLFVYFVKLWIVFISVVETLIIVSGE